ncbi:hypothetical protein B0H17DRAFT_1152905 [Mycena rosella]|uniref:Uncharacterized protein n=1 Tax=Mycena rosella TaxID=1033263 RepID=A0AAD7BAK1_MYCRO|nr:hypothetical protein B0H17DRAFT_1152905 [Mycena rosella]
MSGITSDLPTYYHWSSSGIQRSAHWRQRSTWRLATNGPISHLASGFRSSWHVPLGEIKAVEPEPEFRAENVIARDLSTAQIGTPGSFRGSRRLYRPNVGEGNVVQYNCSKANSSSQFEPWEYRVRSRFRRSGNRFRLTDSGMAPSLDIRIDIRIEIRIGREYDPCHSPKMPDPNPDNFEKKIAFHLRQIPTFFARIDLRPEANPDEKWRRHEFFCFQCTIRGQKSWF